MNITPVGVAVALAVVVALAFLFFGSNILMVFQPQPAGGPPTDAVATSTATGSGDTSNQPVTSLQIVDQKVGTGAEAKAGDSVTVEYVGSLQDGTVFDSTQAHGQPFTFTLGVGQVIAGWDQGVAGMKVGGQRTLVIPPSLGYGAAGAGNGLIPPNAVLIFQVQLDSVQAAK
jgi:FKBP-type peptidyl-prolyl cis-trans isomerase